MIFAFCSQIGFLSTSRYYKGGGYGNLFGFDGMFQLSNKLRVSFDVLKNFNQEPNSNWVDSDDTFDGRSVRLNGEKFNGLGVSVGILRSTEKWSSYIGYKHIDPNYRGDGVMISGFYDGGPGQRANMRGGDIIKKVNDKKVNKIKDMQDIIGKSKPGDLVSFQIQRNSDILNINVEVEKMPKL